MKKVLFVFAVVAASLAANAQSTSSTETGFKFGIGPKVGIVVGDFDQVLSLAFGGEVLGEYKFSPQASAIISAGYTNYSGKNNFGSTGFVPVLVGARFYPSSQVFIGGRLGASFNTESGGGTWFTYEPQVGYNGGKFQLALGYNAASKNSVTLANLGLTGIIKF